MTFKRIMGFIYLAIFIGVMAYKFNYFVTDLEDSIPIVLLVLICLSFLLLAIRRILREG
ncbi:MAG: hypothetical protein AAF985_16665 [Bacteroidota bacterium]